MKKMLVVLLVLTSSIMASENNVCLEVSGTVKVAKASLSEVSISLYKNGAFQSELATTQSGSFSLRFETNNQYEMLISKIGYFPQRVVFNTFGMENDKDYLSYRFAVELFPVIEGIDARLFDHPIAELEYNSYTDDLEKIYNSETLENINKFVVEYEQVKEVLYSKNIKNGDFAFLNKEYEKAIILYNKAIEFNPDNYYPDEQIVMIERIVNQNIRYQLKYDNRIAEADTHYKNKAYQKARKYYKRALRFKEDNYPMAQISTIDKAVSVKKVSAID